MKSTLLIITVCFSSFAFTGACAFNDPSGEPGDGSVTALADKLWMTGSIVAGGEKWYSFTVVNAYDYEINCISQFTPIFPLILYPEEAS